jgi:hypothetical protein
LYFEKGRIGSKTHDDKHLAFAATGTAFGFAVRVDVNNHFFFQCRNVHPGLQFPEFFLVSREQNPIMPNLAKPLRQYVQTEPAKKIRRSK